MGSVSTQDLPRLTEKYKEEYRINGSWGEETFVDVFEDAFKQFPDTKIIGPRRSVTYAELAIEVKRLSEAFQYWGVDAGTVISYQLPNWVETVAVHLASSRVGAIVNPITPIYRESEVEHILNDAGSQILIVPTTFRGFEYPAMIDELTSECPMLERVIIVDGDGGGELSGKVKTQHYSEIVARNPNSFNPPTIDADDIHALLYTSGTTAAPKGVLHTHNTLLYEERTAIELTNLSSSSTVFMPSPLTHITGLLYGLEMPFVEGMDVVLQDQWDASQAVSLIDRYGCTITVGATPFLKGINELWPNDQECPLHAFVCGGADVPPELIRSATDNLDCTAMRVYGLTEFPTVTWPMLDAPREKLAETDGPAAPGVELQIVDLETGEEVPAGTKGELLARGPELMAGYLGTEPNKSAFVGSWFKTGDLAVMGDEGYIEITGRKKDIIVRGGENIPVKDVEDRLFNHPAIDEVAIVAMPDPKMQEKGCAYVTLKPGASFTFEEMIAFLDEQQIAKQKYPERLEIVEVLPKTASGKVQKVTLREAIASKLGLEPVERE